MTREITLLMNIFKLFPPKYLAHTIKKPKCRRWRGGGRELGGVCLVGEQIGREKCNFDAHTHTYTKKRPAFLQINFANYRKDI